MIDPAFGVDVQLLVIALIVLFLFGCGYAYLVYGLGDRKAGYVALFVVVGAGVTLSVEAAINPRAAILSLMLFAASGAPMVAGEIIQHIRARDRAIQSERERARDTIREMGRDE